LLALLRSACIVGQKERREDSFCFDFFNTYSPGTNNFFIFVEKYIMNQKINYTYRYPRPAVTTDCVVYRFDREELQVLLIQRANEPFRGKWAFPGGFLEMEETTRQGALRELSEETGIVPDYLEQFYTFSAIDRDPRERVISVAYIGLVNG
jgi:hypothetical protein